LHLLRRSLFGVSLEDYKHFSTLTLPESLDILLKHSSMPPPPVNYYNNENYSDPAVAIGKTWVNAFYGDPLGSTDFKRADSMKAWWVGLMLNQDRSLTEKMTLFWSNNLATQGYVVKNARNDFHYVALLRSFALGNFKRLTREMTTNAAMLDYLDGSTNTASAPNENYARELQELFTVGKGSGSYYTQADVIAAARILSGWRAPTEANQLNVSFVPADHDTGDK
jgi:hypothetical protein